MLPESVLKLLRDIYAEERNMEVQQKLKDNPEEVLVSLLTEIRKDLPKVSKMLSSTVQMGGFGVLESVKQREAAQKERATK